MVPSVHLLPNCDLPAAPLQLPPASANRTPVPVGTNYPIWQPGIAAPGGGTDGAGLISQPGAVHFGHDIAPSIPSLRWLLLQLRKKEFQTVFKIMERSVIRLTYQNKHNSTSAQKQRM
ncbi:uncharacterized protein LOC119186092 isoform X1 [Rhipicephalus microplus]|uniref:uncharacterized protein LOC119186092 isoform X1 n=1 Tax=Rhipicephalus microplus TaxID=6941 RepID=UPI003F6B713B